MFRWLKEPLFHFLLIGALLFFSYSVFDDTDEYNDNRIVIKQSDLDVLYANFTRTWQRQPSEQEMSGLVEDWIREEIAYREALALGLEQEDAYIKRRLRMKMELILNDMSNLSPPTDQELAAFLEQNPEKFWREPRISFTQIFFQEKPTAEQAEHVLEQVADAGVNIAQLGDPIMLPEHVELSSSSLIDRQFGTGFASELERLTTGDWQGPVRSGFGFHLVRVHSKEAGSYPALEDVKPVVEREYIAQREDDIREEVYTRLRNKYEIVTVDDTAVDPAQ